MLANQGTAVFYIISITLIFIVVLITSLKSLNTSELRSYCGSRTLKEEATLQNQACNGKYNKNES
jgi:hypothetical protein